MTISNNDQTDSSEQKAKDLEEQRARLVDSIASSQPDTLEHKVGWIFTTVPTFELLIGGNPPAMAL